MNKFCFTVDDNIRFLKEVTEQEYESIFEHPYMRVYKRFHKKYGLKVQLNLFYEEDGFNLSQMTARFKKEWAENAEWLKLSFHSRKENVRPYENSGYDEVFNDCKNVNREILRFAGDKSLAKTTTIHFCRATRDGLVALKDNGIKGLLGLYGTRERPNKQYQSTKKQSDSIRRGEIVYQGEIAYAGIDIVLNNCKKDEILSRLEDLSGRSCIKIMIHEQYFYPDYCAYQKDFEEKLDAAFLFLEKNGFYSSFFEELIID